MSAEIRDRRVRELVRGQWRETHGHGVIREVAAVSVRGGTTDRCGGQGDGKMRRETGDQYVRERGEQASGEGAVGETCDE